MLVATRQSLRVKPARIPIANQRPVATFSVSIVIVVSRRANEEVLWIYA